MENKKIGGNSPQYVKQKSELKSSPENDQLAVKENNNMNVKLLDSTFYIARLLKWCTVGSKEFSTFFNIEKHPDEKELMLTKEDVIKCLKTQGVEINEADIISILNAGFMGGIFSSQTIRSSDVIIRQSYAWKV